MIYRIVFGFSGAGVGWAETHAMLNASNNPRDLMPTLTDIANKRAQMLGREFAIVGIRASRYATDAGQRARGSFLLKTQIRNSVTAQIAAAEPADVALIVRGSPEVTQTPTIFDANTNQTFLGAPLDVSVDNAGAVDRGKGGLDSAFLSWRAVMLNTTIGWLANDTILQCTIITTAQNANGTVTFTVAENLSPATTSGLSYVCRVRAVNQGVSPLNGQLIVKSDGLHALTTRQVVGIPTPQTGGFLRLYRPVQPFIDYGDLTLNQTVGNHKKGRPFGSTPGRARKRVRG